MWRTVEYYEDGRPKIDVNEQGAVYSYASKQLLTGDYIYRYIAKAFPEICGEWFEGCHVHHKDHNHFNNAPSNLICLTPEEHRIIHGKSTNTIQQIAENYDLEEGGYKVYCRKSKIRKNGLSPIEVAFYKNGVRCFKNTNIFADPYTFNPKKIGIYELV